MLRFSPAVLLLILGCGPLVTPSHRVAIAPASDASVSPDLADRLRLKIEATLRSGLEDRRLSLRENAAWQVMHGVIAYGDQLHAYDGQRQANVLEYLLGGGSMQGWELGEGDPLPDGRQGMKARLEPGSFIGQGHVDQWLAILAQAGVPLNRSVRVGDKEFTVQDWARQAQWDVSANPVQEYSWTLISLMRYFPDEQVWKAKDGNTWEFDSLVEFEARQDLTSSPCGGMHRLTGLVHAIEFRQRHGKVLDGPWKRAQDRVEESIAILREYQNTDGTFSNNYTQRPGKTADLSQMISSTGHSLEFLAFALPKDRLEEPWVHRAADRLCSLIQAGKNADLDCGGLYHALHGLKVYHRKRFATK
jgi:hypothetical protein